ncbi:hypothetical protein BU15DRAFT_72425 [Melanogaster broomeanus]|nr:hypothetical protein BU15DRAFT_72425 [Melanogaster broomeanus]
MKEPMGVSGLSPRLCALQLIFDSLIHLGRHLAMSLIGVLIFCLLMWALLESALYVSEPSPPQTSRWLSMAHLPLPSPAGSLRWQPNLSLYEPHETDAAVLQFISDQIHHAKALASFSAGLGLPLRAFFEAHQTSSLDYRPIEDVDFLTNFNGFLDPPFVDFTPNSFIGRSFSLALDELGDIISDPPSSSHNLLKRKERHRWEAHSHAIYWRTASNLLLEYSATRLRSKELLRHLQTVHGEVSAVISTPW